MIPEEPRFELNTVVFPDDQEHFQRLFEEWLALAVGETPEFEDDGTLTVWSAKTAVNILPLPEAHAVSLMVPLFAEVADTPRVRELLAEFERDRVLFGRVLWRDSAIWRQWILYCFPFVPASLFAAMDLLYEEAPRLAAELRARFDVPAA